MTNKQKDERQKISNLILEKVEKRLEEEKKTGGVLNKFVKKED